MVWNSSINTLSNNPDVQSATSEGVPNITRLVVDSETRADIQLDEISVPYNREDINNGSVPNQEDVMGSEFPVVRINDLIVPNSWIRRFTMESSDILPTISMSIIFHSTRWVTKNPVKDGDMVSVFIRAGRSKDIKFIRNDYIITNCESRISPSDGKSTMTLSGVLFVPKFLSRNNTKGFIGTSKDVIKKIAMDSSLGFSYNDFDDTDDFQSWICCRDSYINFVQDITMHSWKNELSFFDSWVDFYYNLCFVNVNKFLSSSENEEDIDITYATNTRALVAIKNDESTNSVLSMKMLSNMGAFRGTPFYIKYWNPTNESASISLDEGYKKTSYTYIHNQKLYNGNRDKCFETLDNIPAYDENKKKSYILLRGRAKYDKSTNPENEMERANHDFVNTYNIVEWNGVEYMLGDDDKENTESNDNWSGNVHKNYNRAVSHNEINLSELSKMYITVTCEGLCMQVMRGERIPVYLANVGVADDLHNDTDDTEIPANRFYSGYYLVDSIKYNYKPGNGAFSWFSTTFVLKRREWPTPETI